MRNIDKRILIINKSICKNISRYENNERGLLSQNILTTLRHFVEHISLKEYSTYKGYDDIDITYDNIKDSNKYVSRTGKLKFLHRFHQLLQISASHYMLDENSSERLMLKYYEYLLKIKNYLKNNYNLEVLVNIDEFPLDTDDTFKEYYNSIAYKIDNKENIDLHSSNDRYYIYKVRPFFVNEQIYYEVTFSIATDRVSKFDRIIAFTNIDITSYYAVKLKIRNESIMVLEKKMPIKIIEAAKVSMRPCEINNFAKIFGQSINISTKSKEYKLLMEFLTATGMNLVELIDSDTDYYEYIKSMVNLGEKGKALYYVLDTCRNICKRQGRGKNIIRYLLFKMNNKIIKNQQNYRQCNMLSDLFLDYKCIPFEEMPFNSSLKNHNPKIHDLIECLDWSNNEEEFLARKIKNNTEQEGKIFTSKDELNQFKDIQKLINKYNSKLYHKHEGRRIEEYKNNFYIKGYLEDSLKIIENLNGMCSKGVEGYTESVKYWLESTSYKIDCEYKKEVILRMFVDSRIALIHGSAGTGKSTLINHISQFFNEKKKIYLANTNPAVDNLRRKVKASNCTFKTITKFLASNNIDVESDILIIDECSTVSNANMVRILAKSKHKLLILVGDTFQIESIKFGNWFNLAYKFMPEFSIYELKKPYRSTSCELIKVWDKVRNMDDDILEHLTKNNFSVKLDNSIFDYSEDDPIILCLNYDGLYGINNINSFLQESNQNIPVKWGVNLYKIDDPILFNESERFAPLIYNNMKGRIIDISNTKENIIFDIELDIIINELDALGYTFELIGTSEIGNSIIRFKVNKYKSTDEDDNLSLEDVMPFQVAYAVSIHKAQGLEYSSVKVVINDEIDELITHNIFYTAITRAKNELKIYWTPETENKILKNLTLKNINKDVALVSSKIKENKKPLLCGINN